MILFITFLKAEQLKNYINSRLQINSFQILPNYYAFHNGLQFNETSNCSIKSPNCKQRFCLFCRLTIGLKQILYINQILEYVKNFFFALCVVLVSAFLTSCEKVDESTTQAIIEPVALPGNIPEFFPKKVILE